MAKIKTRAVCIRKIDYSETSQVLWFFTEGQGRITAMAKGSKRAAKKKPVVPVDTCGLYDVMYFQRKDADMVTLAEYEQVEQFAGLRDSVQRYFAALYVLEICQQVVQPMDAAQEYFIALCDTLGALEQGMSVAMCLHFFQLQTLNFLGASPEFSGCVSCGARLKREKRPDILTLSVLGGGLVCQPCRASDGAGMTFQTSRKSVAACEALLQWGLPRQESQMPVAVHDLAALIQPLFQAQFDRPLRMSRYCLRS